MRVSSRTFCWVVRRVSASVFLETRAFAAENAGGGGIEDAALTFGGVRGAEGKLGQQKILGAIDAQIVQIELLRGGEDLGVGGERLLDRLVGVERHGLAGREVYGFGQLDG